MWLAEPPTHIIEAPQAIYLAARPSERIAGVCQVVEFEDGVEVKAQIGLSSVARDYMYRHEKREVDFRESSGAKYTLLKAPRHGKLILGGTSSPDEYFPNEGYLGRDAFVVQVEKGKIQLKIQYFILVDYSANLKHISCPEMPKGSTGTWKIANLNQ